MILFEFRRRSIEQCVIKTLCENAHTKKELDEISNLKIRKTKEIEEQLKNLKKEIKDKKTFKRIVDRINTINDNPIGKLRGIYIKEKKGDKKYKLQVKIDAFGRIKIVKGEEITQRNAKYFKSNEVIQNIINPYNKGAGMKISEEEAKKFDLIKNGSSIPSKYISNDDTNKIIGENPQFEEESYKQISKLELSTQSNISLLNSFGG